MEYTHHYGSPLGGITLGGDGTSLTGLWFDGQRHFAATLDQEREEKQLPVFKTAERWLDIYFGGRCPDFTPPLEMKGTAFQKTVWEILLTITYGKTVTYGGIANLIAAKTGQRRPSPRAVGGAVGRNPISLIIPCHRVVGADGRLTGYAGGLEKKLWLLELEKAGASIIT